MTAIDKDFSGSVPTIYDLYMVPLMFQPMAEEMAKRVTARDPHTLLEVAAGTGVVTAELLKRLPRGSLITATDLNQSMLDVAAVRLPGGEVRMRTCDALQLPFPQQSYDAVVCQFGAMFFPDKAVAFREARRVLREGGSYFVSVWDRLETNAIANAVTQALARIMPDDPPTFFRRVPYSYNDARQITSELLAAGFSDVRHETVSLTGRSPTARHAAVALCQGTPLRGEIEKRAPGRIDWVTDAVTRALLQSHGEGPVETTLQALFFEARA